MEKKALNINLDELCEAIENSSYENEYFLDLETGEILFISDYLDDEETSERKVRCDGNSGHQILHDASIPA